MRRLTLTLAAIAVPLVAFAEAHDGNPAVKARQSHMSLYSFNLGALGAMAKGDTPYDAELAQAHAEALASLASQPEAGYWTEGTSNDEVEGTRALPAIWSDADGFESARAGLEEATATLAGAAGNSLEELQAAFGPTGAACGTCHKTYRAEEE